MKDLVIQLEEYYDKSIEDISEEECREAFRLGIINN